MELTGGTFQVELHDVVANDHHTVGLHIARGQRNGKTLEDHQVLIFHFRDGQSPKCGSYSRMFTLTTTFSRSKV
jgi:hypothetical protein